MHLRCAEKSSICIFGNFGTNYLQFIQLGFLSILWVVCIYRGSVNAESCNSDSSARLGVLVKSEEGGGLADQGDLVRIVLAPRSPSAPPANCYATLQLPLPISHTANLTITEHKDKMEGNKKVEYGMEIDKSQIGSSHSSANPTHCNTIAMKAQG